MKSRPTTKDWTTVNPTNGETLKQWTFVTEDQVQALLLDLKKSFYNWKDLSFSERQKKLSLVLNEMRGDKESLAQAVSLEMGKPIFQARAEVNKSLDAVEFLVSQNFKKHEDQLIEADGISHQITKEPLGVILGIMPWNFPVWQAIRFIFPTLLMGNTILLKHAEITPTVGDKLEKYFSVLEGLAVFKHAIFSHEITEKVISSNLISGLSFTGSTKTGYKLSELAGRYLKKSVMELGGSDAYIVRADADIALAAKLLVRSRLANAGQVCISAKRVIIHESIFDLFISELKSQFEQNSYGNPLDEKTKIGPLAHVRLKDQYNSQVSQLIQNSKVLFHKKCNITSAQNAYVDSYILEGDLNAEIFKSLEIFGPALFVTKYSTDEQALQIANSSIYGLGAGVFSKDTKKAQNLAKSLEAGHVVINEIVRSHVQVPFGGIKSSGMGRELGQEGYLEFSQTKVYSIKIIESGNVT